MNTNTKQHKIPRPVKMASLMRRLGRFLRVERMEGRRVPCGGGSANQLRIIFEGGEILQSYRAIIGAKLEGAESALFLTPLHDYSRTTSTFAGWWCGMNTAERRRGLERGEIVRLAI